MHSPAILCCGPLAAAAILASTGAARADENTTAEAAAVEQAAGGYEFIVVGTRSEQSLEEATAAAEVIDRREIEATGARDLAGLLAMRANVAVEQTQFGASVQLHGLDPDHVLVLVDGQRLAGRQGGVIDLSRIPVDSIGRIEIVRGPASALYGSDAMGGVISIVTRRAGRPFEADGQLRYGERNLVELSGSAATRGEAGLLRVTAGLRRSDAFRLDEGSIATSGSGHDEKHALVRGEVELSDELLVESTASWSLRDQIGVDAGAGGAIYDRLDRLETFSASLRPRFELSRESSLRLTAEGTWLSNQLMQDQRRSSALDKLEEVGEQLFTFGVQSDTRLGSHLLVVGAEALLERMESPRLDGGTGTRDRLGLYVQDEWLITEGVRLGPGLRVDVQEGMGVQPAPRLALRVDPHESLVLRGSYGWAWRAPSFQELLMRFENPSVGYVVEGNPDLRPESSRGATLGAEYRPWRFLRLGLELFRQEVDDLIAVGTVREARAGSPRGFGYVNVERALSRGVEASVHATPWRSLELQAGWAFTDARNRETGAQLEGRARHRISGSATWRAFGGTEATLRASWVGARPFPAEDGSDAVVHAPSYLDLSVHARQEITDEIALLAGGQNLLDAGNASFLPIFPRTFYGGVSFRY